MYGNWRRCGVRSLFVLVPLALGCRDSPDRYVPCRVGVSESNFCASISLLKARLILTLRRIRKCTGTLNDSFLESPQTIGCTSRCIATDFPLPNQPRTPPF